MKKTLSILCLGLMLVFATSPVKAQDDAAFWQSTSPWSFSLSGGFVENTPSVVLPKYASNVVEYNPAAGMDLGLGIRYSLSNWLCLRTEFSLIDKNYQYNRKGDYTKSFHTNYKNRYFSVPLMLQAAFGYEFKVYGFVGVYGGYWLSSHRQGATNTLSQYNAFDEPVDFDADRDNRLDYGFVFGGGLSYTFRQRLEAFLEARYYYGTSDKEKSYMSNNRVHYYYSTFAVNLGIGFNL